jgi:hypothetical protein
MSAYMVCNSRRNILHSAAVDWKQLGISVVCVRKSTDVFSVIFFKWITAHEVYTACTMTRYKIVPLTNLNKYLHNDTIETEVSINISENNGSEKVWKKNCDFR